MRRLTSSITRTAMAAALALTAACVGGSGETGRDSFAGDGDTGAAAPAATYSPDNPGAPDSTTGMSDRTGQKGAAGTRVTGSDSGLKPTSPASSAPKPKP